MLAQRPPPAESILCCAQHLWEAPAAGAGRAPSPELARGLARCFTEQAVPFPRRSR